MAELDAAGLSIGECSGGVGCPSRSGGSGR